MCVFKSYMHIITYSQLFQTVIENHK